MIGVEVDLANGLPQTHIWGIKTHIKLWRDTMSIISQIMHSVWKAQAPNDNGQFIEVDKIIINSDLLDQLILERDAKNCMNLDQDRSKWRLCGIKLAEDENIESWKVTVTDYAIINNKTNLGVSE